MIRKIALILIATVLLLGFTLTPCYALLGGGGANVGQTGLGAGFMFPDIDGLENDNSLYYLFDYKMMNYLMEINYFNDSDLDGWMIHADYTYPITGVMDSSAYVGLGYSYIFGNSDVLEDENGLNICLGFTLQKNIDIRGRYLFLGGGDHILSAGATMYF
jgi:hypothetical protein